MSSIDKDGAFGVIHIYIIFVIEKKRVSHSWRPFWRDHVVHVIYTREETGSDISSAHDGQCCVLIVRRRKFSTFLLLNTCMLNALGQFVGYKSLKYYFPVSSDPSVRSLRFLGALFLLPVVFASAVAAIPCSYGFHLLAGVPLNTIVVNYFIGHATGTATIPYPGIIVPVLRGDVSTIPAWWKFSPIAAIGPVVCVLHTVQCIRVYGKSILRFRSSHRDEYTYGPVIRQRCRIRVFWYYCSWSDYW